MSNDVTRIGRPPQAPPPAPELKRRKELLILLAGLVLGVAAAGIYFGARLLNREPDAVPQVPMPSGPNFKVLDVPATCVLLIPIAKDGADAVTAMVQHPDGSTVDWAKVDKAIRDLNLTKEVAAPELHDDIGQQAATLSQLASMRKTGVNMTLDLTAFRSSGLRIGARCGQYAN